MPGKGMLVYMGSQQFAIPKCALTQQKHSFLLCRPASAGHMWLVQGGARGSGEVRSGLWYRVLGWVMELAGSLAEEDSWWLGVANRMSQGPVEAFLMVCLSMFWAPTAFTRCHATCAGVLCDRSGGVRALWGSYSEQLNKEEQEWTAGGSTCACEPARLGSATLLNSCIAPLGRSSCRLACCHLRTLGE